MQNNPMCPIPLVDWYQIHHKIKQVVEVHRHLFHSQSKKGHFTWLNSFSLPPPFEKKACPRLATKTPSSCMVCWKEPATFRASSISATGRALERQVPWEEWGPSASPHEWSALQLAYSALSIGINGGNDHSQILCGKINLFDDGTSA